MSSLAFDSRTKPRLTGASKIEARRSLDSVRLQGARDLRRFYAIALKAMRDPTVGPVKRFEMCMQFFDRFGIPKRTQLDANVTETLSAAEMREIYQKAVEERLDRADPKAGRVAAVDVEFDLHPGGNGVAGQGPRALPQ